MSSEAASRERLKDGQVRGCKVAMTHCVSGWKALSMLEVHWESSTLLGNKLSSLDQVSLQYLLPFLKITASLKWGLTHGVFCIFDAIHLGHLGPGSHFECQRFLLNR